MGPALLLSLCLAAQAAEPLRVEPVADAAAPLEAAAVLPVTALVPALNVAPLPALTLVGAAGAPAVANEPLIHANDNGAPAAQATAREPAEAQAAAAAQRFDNTYRPKAEVVAALGFDPVGRTGDLMSVPTKSDVRVVGLSQGVVAKVADRPAIARELFVRNVIVETPLFSRHFDVIPGLAFRRRWYDPRGVLVMERLPLRRAPELSIPRKAALAALAYGLGISDHNEDGIFSGQDGKTLINDFEKALTPLREGMRAGALSDPALHLSAAYLNDYADYAGAVDEWRGALAARREELFALMLKSGMTDREALRAFGLLARNAELMEGQLKKDIARENEGFLRRAAWAGLTPRQAEALSGINRASHLGDPSLRDAVRRFVRDRGKNAARWKLWPERGNLTPEEWKDYLDSREDNKTSERS